MNNEIKALDADIATAAALRHFYEQSGGLVMIAQLQALQDKARRVRSEVDAMTAPIFTQWCQDNGTPVDEYSGEPITCEADTYKAAGDYMETFGSYHTLVYAAVLDNFGPEWGDRCPAISAESDVVDAENTLIAAVADVMKAPKMKQQFGAARRKSVKICSLGKYESDGVR